jgi:hypothetical protein
LVKISPFRYANFGGFLEKKNSRDKIRVLTDNTRLEQIEGEGWVWNENAAAELTSILREEKRLNNIPILVYTLGGIPRTMFVKEFALTGSTIEWDYVAEYIDGLAGLNDTSRWAKFGASSRKNKRGSQAPVATSGRGTE